MLVERQSAEEERCYVGNDVLACYPTADTTVVQDRYGRLIWNQNYPEFTNNGGNVDVYLFRDDDDRLMHVWPSLQNAQGRLSFQPQDDWWQGMLQADNFNGTYIPWPYYFVITYAGKGLDGQLNRLATWHAVQTALPTAIAEARASSSSSSAAEAAATASAGATLTQSAGSATVTAAPTVAASVLLSELNAFSAILTSSFQSVVSAENLTGAQVLFTTATTTFPEGISATATASVLANGSLLPLHHLSSQHGKIVALTLVFGLISLITLVVLWYLCIRAVRRRSGDRTQRRGLIRSDLSDTHSGTPMMPTKTHDDAGAHGEKSPPTSPDAGHGQGGWTKVEMGEETQDRRSPLPHEVERSLTSSEVWRLANAFRSALRRPLTSPPSSFVAAQNPHFDGDEGADVHRIHSLQQQVSISRADSHASSQEGTAQDLLREDLHGEGRELKSVVDRKKPHLYHSSPALEERGDGQVP